MPATLQWLMYGGAFAAVVAEGRSDQGMAGCNVADVLEMRSADADPLEKLDRGSDGRLQDHGVLGAAEHIDAALLQVGERIDHARGGKGFRKADHRRRIGREEGHPAHADAGEQFVVDRAVVGSAGDHAGAGDRSRIRDLQLHRHERTRGQTGHRRPVRIGAIGGELDRRRARGESAGEQEGAEKAAGAPHRASPLSDTIAH